ncbi:hypothetical protein ACOZVK_003791 [Cronobacter sakazakii]
MVITQDNVNDDIRMISDSLTANGKVLVRPIAALKVAFFLPMTILAGYLLAMSWLAMTYTPYTNAFGDVITFGRAMSAEIATVGFCTLFALFIGVALYGPSLAYLSVPEKTRIDSVVITSLRKTGMKLVTGILVINWTVALLACLVDSTFICASPFILLLSVFLLQWVISAEVTRYGMSSLMTKLTKLAKKI